MPRTGRPREPVDEQQINTIKVYLDDETHEALLAVSKRRKLSYSSLLRLALIEHIEREESRRPHNDNLAA